MAITTRTVDVRPGTHDHQGTRVGSAGHRLAGIAISDAAVPEGQRTPPTQVRVIIPTAPATVGCSRSVDDCGPVGGHAVRAVPDRAPALALLGGSVLEGQGHRLHLLVSLRNTSRSASGPVPCTWPQAADLQRGLPSTVRARGRGPAPPVRGSFGDQKAMRGSRSRLRALRDCGCVKKTTCSSSIPVHTGTECGAPLGSTVARWA